MVSTILGIHSFLAKGNVILSFLFIRSFAVLNPHCSEVVLYMRSAKSKSAVFLHISLMVSTALSASPSHWGLWNAYELNCRPLSDITPLGIPLHLLSCFSILLPQ